MENRLIWNANRENPMSSDVRLYVITNSPYSLKKIKINYKNRKSLIYEYNSPKYFVYSFS